MERDVFAIGHITNDTEPTPHIGGGVTYTGIALHHVGYATHIITKSPPNHPYIQKLEENGVSVVNLPTRDKRRSGKMTTFQNIYGTQGHRTQHVPEVAEPITKKDVPSFPPIAPDAVILIAPVIAEVEPSLIAALHKGHEGNIVVTPQGYFRQRAADNTVQRTEWKDVDMLSSADIVVLSDEDLTTGQVFNSRLLDKIRHLSPLVVMTQGSDGVIVFQGTQIMPLSAFDLSFKELEQGDFTGAGDTFAAGFIAKYFETHDLKKAAVFGMLYAAIKIAIAAKKGMGIAAIPTKGEVEAFIQANPDRIREFLSTNQVDSL